MLIRVPKTVRFAFPKIRRTIHFHTRSRDCDLIHPGWFEKLVPMESKEGVLPITKGFFLEPPVQERPPRTPLPTVGLAFLVELEFSERARKAEGIRSLEYLEVGPLTPNNGLRSVVSGQCSKT